MLEQLKRIFDSKSIDTLILFVTSTCNCRCDFCCYSNNLNRSDDMSFKQLKEVSLTIGEIRSLMVSGGEPFLRKDLVKIVGEFVSNARAKSVGLPTNGTATDHIVKGLSQLCTEYKGTVFTLSVSLDGPEELHDKMRGVKGTFAKAMNTLERLAEMRKKHKNLRVKTGSTVTRDNQNELKLLIDYLGNRFPWLDEHSIEIERDSSIRVTDFASKSQLSETFRLLVRKAGQSFEQKQHAKGRQQVGSLPSALIKMAQVGVSYYSAEVKRKRIFGKDWPFPCTAGRTISVVYSNGELAPCELRSESVPLGKHGYNIAKAMKSPEFQKILSRIPKDRCFCTHACFVNDSLGHSGFHFLRHVPFIGAFTLLRSLFVKEIGGRV